jgi:signal transduction histidine kinase
MTLFQASCFITFLISFLFGLFAILQNKKLKLNVVWFFCSLSISIWSLGFFGVVSAPNYYFAWISQYILDIGGILVPILFLNFILILMKIEKKHWKIILISWISAISLIIINFTNLFKSGMIPYGGFDYWINPGPLYFLFPISFIFFFIYSLSLLVYNYKKSEDKLLKAQIKYIILAQIFGFGGGVTNFFPQLFKIYPFGNYFIILYIVFISYTVFKHNLFNVRVIITELFILVITIMLLAKTLLSGNNLELIENGILFFSVGIFGILLVRSVSKEIRQREQIEKLAKEIEQSYEIEKKAKEELEILDQSKNQFLLAIQHHLRTPLTAMMGYSDLILTGAYGRQTKQTKEVVGKILISTKGLIKMVNDFLDVTQFQLGKSIISLKPNVNVLEIINEILVELKYESDKKELYLNLKKPNIDLPEITADREKLKAAIYNIIDNAVKYTTKGGVTISIIRNDGLRIVIEDTGMGISKENSKNIFEKTFERGEAAKKTFINGRGIGLYITNQIIKAHKGNIWAESNGEGKGSTFYIELPIKI